MVVPRPSGFHERVKDRALTRSLNLTRHEIFAKV